MQLTIAIDHQSWGDFFSEPLHAQCFFAHTMSVATPLPIQGSISELLDAAKEEAVYQQEFELASAIRDLKAKWKNGEIE